MSWLDGITQALYSWQNSIQQAFTPGGGNNSYQNPADDEEDDDSEYEWVTHVVFGTPLRETKCIFVPEMNDFYSDEELNTIYHSANEYRNAVNKYGLIYKSQKFANADTAQKLLDYAKDWIKNNYHGGITNFNITALDLHLVNPEFDKYLVGQRVNVQYMDPAVQEETEQTLTVISAEYDLNNPDKNSYKIGIPDVSLNKVYGETSKKGGGGGGGGKTSDQTDNETDTEVDGLIDDAEADAARQQELFWAMLFKGTKNGDETYALGDKQTPSSKDPTGDWAYGLTPDFLKASLLQGVNGAIDNITSKYIKSSGGVDCETVSSNKGNITDVNSDNVKASKKVESKDVTVTDTADIKYLKVNGQNIRFAVSGGKPRLTIGGQTFTLSTE